MTEDLPRRPYQQLPPPAGGLESVVLGGRRLRRRRQALVLSGVAGAAVLAITVAVAGAGASPATTDRLITGQTASPTPSVRVSGRPLTTPPPRGGAPSALTTASPASTGAASSTPEPGTATSALPEGNSYRTPPMRRTYEPADPWGARICTPDEANGSTRAGWCLDGTVVRTSQGHDLGLSLCRDQTGPATLSFSEAQEVELVVRREGEEVWRWSAGRDTRGAGHALAVEAGACWHWTVAWTDVDSSGRELTGGSYSLTVVSLARELSGFPDETTPFAI